MPTYGYRLFTLGVYEGLKRTAIDLGKVDGRHFVEVLEELLKALMGKTMVGDAPQGNSDVLDFVDSVQQGVLKGYSGKPAFRVDQVEIVERTVRATVMAGNFGSHDVALSAVDGDSDADISQKAACREFRVIFALPETGSGALLAVEDISRSCPVSVVTSWLRWASKNSSYAQVSNKPDSFPGWSFRTPALTDEDRLSELIKLGQVEKLELVKRTITAARTRESVQYKVTAPIVSANMLDLVGQLVKTWQKPKKSNDEDSAPVASRSDDEEAAKKLAAIVGPDVAELDLDDGWVVLKDADDRTSKVSPTRMSEIFVYKQPGRGKLVTPAFYTEVSTRAKRLQEAAGLVINWPDR